MSFDNEIAQQIILDHNRNPYNREKPEIYTHYAKGENKSRGDQIEVFLNIENGIVQKSNFWGSGGAMFTASSSIMTKSIENCSLEQVSAIFDKFLSIFNTKFEDCDDEIYGEMFVFCGIKEYPSRVKCSTLPWYTMKAALENYNKTVTTEI